MGGTQIIYLMLGGSHKALDACLLACFATLTSHRIYFVRRRADAVALPPPPPCGSHFAKSKELS